jgi:hypothetical protein
MVLVAAFSGIQRVVCFRYCHRLAMLTQTNNSFRKALTSKTLPFHGDFQGFGDPSTISPFHRSPMLMHPSFQFSENRFQLSKIPVSSSFYIPNSDITWFRRLTRLVAPLARLGPATASLRCWWTGKPVSGTRRGTSSQTLRRSWGGLVEHGCCNHGWCRTWSKSLWK